MLLPSNLRTHVRIAMLNVVERTQNLCCHTIHVCLFAYDRTKEQFRASTSSTNFDSTYVQILILCEVVKISGLE